MFSLPRLSSASSASSALEPYHPLPEVEEEGCAEGGGEGEWADGVSDTAEAGGVSQQALRPCFGMVLGEEAAVDAPLVRQQGAAGEVSYAEGRDQGFPQQAEQAAR